MGIRENKYYYSYSVGGRITAGFTGDMLKGVLPYDLRYVFPGAGIAFMDQCHGDRVLWVEEPGVYEGDGIISGARDIILVVKTADCLPLLLFNEKENIIGAVHMGWRSAEKGILENIHMDLSDFKVIAGPGLRKCCYSVGEEFLGFKRIGSYVTREKEGLYFDPIAFARKVLTEQGLEEENFIDTGICSVCSGMEIPSYRKTKTDNRTLSFIADPRYTPTPV